jgi:hypothetical protein
MDMSKNCVVEPTKSTASSAAEERLKSSLMGKMKKKMKGSGASSGSTNTTLPAMRNIKRIVKQHKGNGI